MRVGGEGRRASKRAPFVTSGTKLRASSSTLPGLHVARSWAKWAVWGLLGPGLPASHPGACTLPQQVLPIVVFFSCVMSVLYYVGLMQWVIQKVSSPCRGQGSPGATYPRGSCSPRTPCTQSPNPPSLPSSESWTFPEPCSQRPHLPEPCFRGPHPPTPSLLLAKHLSQSLLS